MKKILLIIALLTSVNCMAQEGVTFPFQGGSRVMTQFFKDSLKISREIKHIKASGVVVFKFTADDNGVVRKIVIYYADDANLAPPAIEALRKSSHKWIIPEHEKLHDFIIPFLIRIDPSEALDRETQNSIYDFYSKRKPIVARDQMPLDMTTLLPTIVVNYDLK